MTTMSQEGISLNSYCSTTHGLNYTIQTRQRSRPEPVRCMVVVASVANTRLELKIPCYYCSYFHRLDQYLEFYEQLLAEEISSHFPNIPCCCVDELANTFKTSILRPATATHRCPHPGWPATVHLVEIDIKWQLHLHVMEEAVHRTLMNLEAIFTGLVWPDTKPASRRSVYKLLDLKFLYKRYLGNDRFERGWSCTECIICMDEIETRGSSLTMPCSHAFHEGCLIRWLNTNHVCPLCRYRMPTRQD